MTLDRETLAEAVQQFWQGPSGRAWSGHEKSCCEALPGQADWFRRLADHILAENAQFEATTTKSVPAPVSDPNTERSSNLSVYNNSKWHGKLET